MSLHASARQRGIKGATVNNGGAVTPGDLPVNLVFGELVFNVHSFVPLDANGDRTKITLPNSGDILDVLALPPVVKTEYLLQFPIPSDMDFDTPIIRARPYYLQTVAGGGTDEFKTAVSTRRDGIGENLDTGGTSTYSSETTNLISERTPYDLGNGDLASLTETTILPAPPNGYTTGSKAETVNYLFIKLARLGNDVEDDLDELIYCMGYHLQYNLKVSNELAWT